MRAKRGNLDVLNKYFDRGKEFELTQEEYEKETNGILSTDSYYLTHNSALARKSKSKGFYIEIKPMEFKPMKICFKKMK